MISLLGGHGSLTLALGPIAGARAATGLFSWSERGTLPTVGGLPTVGDNGSSTTWPSDGAAADWVDGAIAAACGTGRDTDAFVCATLVASICCALVALPPLRRESSVLAAELRHAIGPALEPVFAARMRSSASGRAAASAGGTLAGVMCSPSRVRVSISICI